MKTIFTICLLVFVIHLHAQTDSAEATTAIVKTYNLQPVDTFIVEKYCEVVATAKMFSRKVTIEVDFGDEQKFWSTKDLRIRDEAGKAKNFNNVVDALNYMATLGWKLHSTILLGSGPYVYHFIFKKEFKKE